MSSNNVSPNNASATGNNSLADGYMAFLVGLHDLPIPNVPPMIETSVHPRVQPSEIGSNAGSLATGVLGQVSFDDVDDIFLTQEEKENAIAQAMILDYAARMEQIPAAVETPSPANIATLVEAGSQQVITAMWGGVGGGVLRTSDVYYVNETLRVIGRFRERSRLPDDFSIEGLVLERITTEVNDFRTGFMLFLWKTAGATYTAMQGRNSIASYPLKIANDARHHLQGEDYLHGRRERRGISVTLHYASSHLRKFYRLIVIEFQNRVPALRSIRYPLPPLGYAVPATLLFSHVRTLLTGYYTPPIDPTDLDTVDMQKMGHHRNMLTDIIAANGDEARYLHESMRANRSILTVPIWQPGTIDTRVVYYQAGRQPLARAVQPTEPPGFINIASTSGAG